MQLLEVVHHLLGFKHGDDLALGVVIAHADNRHAQARAIIHVQHVVGAALVHQEGRFDAGFLHLAEDGIQVLIGVDVADVDAQLFHHDRVKHEIVGQGGVLHGGHRVDFAVNGDGAPHVLRNDGLQLGHGVQQGFDVQQDALLDVRGVAAAVGEDDVKILTAVDDGVAAVAVSAPAEHVNVQRDADFFFQVLVNLGFPGFVVVRHAAAQGDPGHRDLFRHSQRGEGQQHQSREEQGEKFSHETCLLKKVLGIYEQPFRLFPLV